MRHLILIAAVLLAPTAAYAGAAADARLELALAVAASTGAAVTLTPAQEKLMLAELKQRQCVDSMGDRGIPASVQKLARNLAADSYAEAPSEIVHPLVSAVHVLPRYTRKNAKGKVVIQVTRAQQQAIAVLAVAEAEKQGVDPAFVLSFIGQESGYYAKARGGLGEIGLMQLLPVTAKTMLLREDPKAKLTDKKVARMLENPATNIRLGVALLKELQDNLEELARRKRVDMRKVLAAGYNAGQVAVAKTLEKHKRTPRSTEEYVTGIMGKVKKINKQVKKAEPKGNS